MSDKSLNILTDEQIANRRLAISLRTEDKQIMIMVDTIIKSHHISNSRNFKLVFKMMN